MPVFTCQGVPSHGVSLTPPSAPEFPHLLEAIRIRAHERVDGAPPKPDIDGLMAEELECAAILLNYSNKTIEELALRWSFETPGIRPQVLCRNGLLGQSEILTLRPKPLVLVYWNTIMPGSVRLITREHMFGDNRDIRPPRPDELHRGGWIQGLGGPLQPVQATSVFLTLDAILFQHGEFTGPDQCGLWDQISAEIAVKMKASELARAALAEGFSADQAITTVLGYTDEATFPSPRAERGPEAFQRETLSRYLMWARDNGSSDQAVQTLIDIGQRPKPLVRRI